MYQWWRHIHWYIAYNPWCYGAYMDTHVSIPISLVEHLPDFSSAFSSLNFSRTPRVKVPGDLVSTALITSTNRHFLEFCPLHHLYQPYHSVRFLITIVITHTHTLSLSIYIYLFRNWEVNFWYTCIYIYVRDNYRIDYNTIYTEFRTYHTTF